MGNNVAVYTTMQYACMITNNETTKIGLDPLHRYGRLHNEFSIISRLF